MPVTIGGGLSFCGRELKPEELDLIRQITREFSTLSLTELAHTICELLEWRRPNGGLKSRECYLFLQANACSSLVAVSSRRSTKSSCMCCISERSMSTRSCKPAMSVFNSDLKAVTSALNS